MTMKIAAAALAVTAALTACGANPTPPSPQPSSTAPSVAQRNEHLWHVLDDNGNRERDLPDDDPAVAEVRKLVVLHSGVTDNRAPDNVTASVAAEFGYYHPAFVDDLRAQKYDTKLVDLFTANGLATRQVSIAWYESTFSKNMTTATAQFETTFEFTAANPAYLTANQFALNEPYTQRRTISLTRSGSTWQISRIEKDRLTRVEAPGR
ncbi:hypothetical protein [Actinokineospora sp. HUAS TT18]|uniref:hypothetical protein n=1 Tax=Actinokineospora sp. HUAS TT18 TaxID=3447451 RepID=UPI003F521F8D